MTSRYLTAFEHQPLTVGEDPANSDISLDEAELLSSLNELRPGFCEREYLSVKLSQYCGLVRLGDRVLEILPKVHNRQSPPSSRGLLLRLLKEASSFHVFQHLEVGHELHKSPLLEVFIAAFFGEVAQIVRGGLIRQYQTREDDLRVVRGRILLTRQLAILSNRPDRIACEFDDLTFDNTWNRFLKRALRIVRPWIRNSELSRRWAELMAVFEDVADVAATPSDFKGLKFDRQAIRYRHALEWARWIVGLLSPEIRAGENTAPALLFDMNVLFQNVVVSLLRRQAQGDSSLDVVSQDTGKHLAAETSTGSVFFALKPDVVVKRGPNVTAVCDAKWKRVLKTQAGVLVPDGSDVYQMHAYASGYNCGTLALIYPWYSDLAGARETTFWVPLGDPEKNVLRIVCVNLATDPFEFMFAGVSPSTALGFHPRTSFAISR